MSSHGTDPEDVDATFAAIVADLRAEGVGEFVDEPVEPQPRPEKTPPAEPEQPEPSWRVGGTTWDDTVLGDDPADDEEHYVPPEPPPLPRPGKGAFVVLLFFVVGLFLLIAPGLIGVTQSLGTPLGILALATAIALLLLRVKQGPPDGADPTNGAQV
ncbi:hypothetical protein LWP59_29515 [Amycolatopsis acidiphila]|uniref:DUF308 domain-containing protein n=1 Tax=Amycolatopsis acidiphila TaxID=715473 RepID=A0A558A7H6_9PSEU|nr:hypothetical protein [Amycolatopsis acidiphila]TVT20219.1 hypothetical protein FNH06_21550 [Amycolatopsis acidiphila]UIJ58232.1 hypothetical protein LWP59_29515 [Amycolatopsis acidiphila]GHG69272.1 hypothetical protein GCM10017788_29410 [Amycolatopsis acidiphila]